MLASTRFTARLHCVARPQNDRRQSPSVARPRSVLDDTLVSDDDDDDDARRYAARQSREFLINVAFRLGCSTEEGVSKESAQL